MSDKHFFALLRLALNGTFDECLNTDAIDWRIIYKSAKRQSLLGICFAGVERLPNNLLPSKDLLLLWLGQVEMIKSQNKRITEAISHVKEHFTSQGMQMVLLKGQGNGCYYNQNSGSDLAALRTGGDIDAWVFPNSSLNSSIDELLRNDEHVLKWLWKQDPGRRHCYIHTDYPDFDGVSVELHFRPSYLNSPYRNHRIQRWFAETMIKQAENEVVLPSSDVKVSIPTIQFNLVYQLSHLYRHIFDDGLGLRQVVDYYMLLKAYHQLSKISPKEDEYIIERIKEFGMYDFARALMFVMQVALGMQEDELLCPVDKKRGELLLNEIMAAGNFGHYDSRNISFKHNNGVTRFLRRQWRNMRFILDYPGEVLSVPLYRVYQEFWRLKMDVRCKS